MGRFVLWISGWTQVDSLPPEPKYVAIAAPHASNWDLILLLAVAWVNRIKISWMGKHTLFRGPLGWVLKRFGGIPINRTGPHQIVDQIAKVFQSTDRLILVIPPEGTRKRTDYWKSGFYHIARLAHVPIIPGALDYARKEASTGPIIRPKEDTLHDDMEAIRAFYRDKRGRFPEKSGPIRLREEDPKSDSTLASPPLSQSTGSQETGP